MADLVLTYFDARGRVDPSRLMLELSGVPYAYQPVATDAWPERKAEFLARTPFGQLPILEEGGESLCQSAAIHRYLADRLELYGKTARERARVDEIAEMALDLLVETARFYWAPDFAARRATHRDATRAQLVLLDAYFRRTRVAAGRWIDAGRYTLADVLVAYVLETWLPLHPGLVEEFPELHGFATGFYSAPGVAEYVRGPRRPRTFTVRFASFGGKPEETHQWGPGAG